MWCILYVGRIGHAVAVPVFSKGVPHLHTLFYCDKILESLYFLYTAGSVLKPRMHKKTDTDLVPHTAMSEVVHYVVERGIPNPKGYSSTLC